MIDATDRQPCDQGYAVTLSDGTRLHVWAWPSGDTLVVRTRDGAPVSTFESRVATFPLTEQTSHLLGDIWAAKVNGSLERAR